VLRLRLPLFLLAALSLGTVLAAAPPPPRPRPTPTPWPTTAPRKTPPRVFTNDDLEATKDKPAAVQNLTATGGETSYEHAPDTGEPAPEPTPPIEDQPTPEQVRIKQLEDDIVGLDAQAKQLLWQYLQSTDTDEILRLKAEQKGILDQLEAARQELANLRAGASQPTPEATSPPG
jgi:hypothetical protein